MRTLELAGGRQLKVHDILERENIKFITDRNDPINTAKAREEFLKIPKGEGLVIFRARENYPCISNLLVEKIVQDDGCKDYFWNERPDIDAWPVCMELILIR